MATTTQQRYYTIVSHGRAGRAGRDYPDVMESREQALAAWRDLTTSPSCAGSVRVLECDTRELAETADISELRAGERVIAS